VRRYYSGWQEQPGGTLGIGPYVHVSTTQSDLTKEIKHSTKNKKYLESSVSCTQHISLANCRISASAREVRFQVWMERETR
jgi:hypothetical protein